MSASCERDRIVSAQLDRAPGQPRSVSALFGAIHHPAIDLAPRVAPRSHAVRGGKIRIQFDRSQEEAQRLASGFSATLIKALHSTQEIIVSIETLGRLMLCTIDFRLLELRRERAHHG